MSNIQEVIGDLSKGEPVAEAAPAPAPDAPKRRPRRNMTKAQRLAYDQGVRFGEERATEGMGLGMAAIFSVGLAAGIIAGVLFS